jgi:23S rRNA (pseudouridine1915-N3)-methyltransferase
MKITLLQVGKTDDDNLTALFCKYEKRINHYISFQTITIPELKNSGSLSSVQYKERESELILQQIKDKEYVVLLDEHGKEFTSKGFAGFLQQRMNESLKEICFVIGGPYGVSDKIKQASRLTISLSKMTFPHQLIRVIYVEQLYRALTIIKNIPYHNE